MLYGLVKKADRKYKVVEIKDAVIRGSEWGELFQDYDKAMLYMEVYNYKIEKGDIVSL